MGQKGLVYHYTSIETLYSIMKNKELWLSSFFSIDDMLEDGEIKKSFVKYFEKNIKIIRRK